MPNPAQEQAESLKRENEDIRRALTEVKGLPGPPPTEPDERPRLVLGALLVLAAGVLAALLHGKVVAPPQDLAPLLQRVSDGILLGAAIFTAARLVRIYAIRRVDDPVARHTLRSVTDLVAFLLIATVVISVLFVNWYTAAVSLGVVSLIVGLALQTTLTSLIAWIYIVVRRPYRIGDRIKIGDATGDVIDVSYLDTTLWEFGGQYLSTDHPSGRVIKFPNANVLSSMVWNYSWPLFPYIWNEIRFQIAYDSDLEFVAETLRRVTEEDLGEAMVERVRVFKELLAQTPVDHLEVQERPVVVFRVSDNTWLEAMVRYVVEPRDAGPTKTRLLRKLLAALNAHPERVRFPKGDSR